MIGDQYAMLALREVEEDSGERLALTFIWTQPCSAWMLDDEPARESFVRSVVEHDFLHHYDAACTSGQVPDEAIAVGPLWVNEGDARRLHERYSNQFVEFGFEWSPGVVFAVMGAYIERSDRGASQGQA